jgi:hypothetical protein
MDFYQIQVGETKEKSLELYPDFVVGRSADLMVQGGRFYAIWDPEKGLWSRDEYDVQRIVDEDMLQEKERLQGNRAATHREVHAVVWILLLGTFPQVHGPYFRQQQAA